MKIKLSGTFPERGAIERHLLLEGETIDVNGPSHGPCPVIGSQWGTRIPLKVLEALGLPVAPLPSLPLYVLTRMFSGGEGLFTTQLMLGFPIWGLMNEGLGPLVPSAYGAKYIDPTFASGAFETMEPMLREMSYSGPLSLSFRGSDIVEALCGVPFPGLFNLLEGASGRLGRFLTCPEGEVLLESWTTSVAISRSPYPHVLTSDRLHLDVPPRVEKHLWLLHSESFRHALYTDHTLLMVATAWSPTLFESSRRALRTSRGLALDGAFKQYRTDVGTRIQESFLSFSSL